MQTREVTSQETPKISGANDDQEDLVITIKKIIKDEFQKLEKKIYDQPALTVYKGTLR